MLGFDGFTYFFFVHLCKSELVLGKKERLKNELLKEAEQFVWNGKKCCVLCFVFLGCFFFFVVCLFVCLFVFLAFILVSSTLCAQMRRG